MDFEIRDTVYLPYNLGLSINDKYISISVAHKSKTLKLLLFERNVETEVYTFDFDKKKCLGDIWFLSLYVKNIDKLSNMEYAFEDEHERFCDPYGRTFSGRDSWGRFEQEGNLRRSSFILSEFNWETDKAPLNIPWSESIIYRLHIRGFTKAPSSKVVHSGTFKGAIEKIPYLKALGITAVDIMPCQEFEELMPLNPAYDNLNYKISEKTDKTAAVQSRRLNYWGYTDTLHFAPKSSFCMKKNRNPSVEFKEMVKSFHAAGIEVITEFSFKILYISVGYVFSCDLKGTLLHNLILNHILDFFNAYCTIHAFTALLHI